jgi:hypothetical protein
MTSEETVTPDRMNAFADGVFAVIINATYLLLCLEAVDRSAPHKVGPRAIDDAYAIACDAGGLRGRRCTSLPDRWHDDNLPLPGRVPEPSGTGTRNST